MYYNEFDREEGCVLHPVLTEANAITILASQKECVLVEKGVNLVTFLGFSNYCFPLQYRAIVSYERLYDSDCEPYVYNAHVWDEYQVERYIYYIKEND